MIVLWDVHVSGDGSTGHIDQNFAYMIVLWDAHVSEEGSTRHIACGANI